MRAPRREEAREQSEEQRQKREERREKREERREEREERREKKEYTPQETARGPQMRPPEVPTRGTDPSLHHTAPQREVDRRLESLHFKGGS